jgi:hypothetical protein
MLATSPMRARSGAPPDSNSWGLAPGLGAAAQDGTPIGVIGIWRREVRRSASDQLLSTFADQAVIAIENVRLFTERAQP